MAHEKTNDKRYYYCYCHNFEYSESMTVGNGLKLKNSNRWIGQFVVNVIIVIALLSTTCSLITSAQDINTNTVLDVPSEKELSQLSYPGVSSPAPKNVKPTPAAELVASSNKAKQAQVSVIDYICPSHELAGLPLIFSIPCKTSTDCTFLGNYQRCCNRICRKVVPAPPKEPQHRAVLGVSRMCPKDPVPEILPVTNCATDFDCEKENRICCPDKDLKLYCRTAAPVWSQLPFPLTHAPLMSIIEYMQCQTPPPTLLNLFPQPCNRTIECLPNLCCQEGPKKFCRPPKKSVLSLVAQVTQRFARGLRER